MLTIHTFNLNGLVQCSVFFPSVHLNYLHMYKPTQMTHEKSNNFQMSCDL